MTKTSYLSCIRSGPGGVQAGHTCLEQYQGMEPMLSFPHLSTCSLVQIHQALSLQAQAQCFPPEYQMSAWDPLAGLGHIPPSRLFPPEVLLRVAHHLLPSSQLLTRFADSGL